MAVIESSVEINGNIDLVYNLAKNVESFHEFMPDVKSVKIIEKNEDCSRIITEWEGIVKEFKTIVKWTEEDIWDFEKKTCDFSLVKGDYSKYSGKWTFTDLGDKTRFDSVIEVEYDVPLIGALIKGIIAKKMKENVENMLAAIKNQIENN